MKAAIFSDLHIHPFHAFAKVGPEGFNSRLHQISKVAHKIIQDAANKGCKALLFGGDWFHEKRQTTEQLDLSGRILSLATNLGMTVGMVPGNHDIVSEGQFSPIHALRSFGTSIKLLDEGAIEFGAAGFRVAGLPYCRKREELVDRIKRLKKHDLLMLHAPCVGAEMASELVQMDNEEAVGADQLLHLSKAKLVVCGHYHKPQFYTAKGWNTGELSGLTYKNVRLLIPGAPCQHSFSDCGQTRGWWELDTEDMSMKFHYVTGEAPEFIKISYKEFLKHPTSVAGRFVHFTIPERTKKSTRLEVIEAIRGVAADVRVILESDVRAEAPPRTDLTPGTHPSRAMSVYAESNPPPDKGRTMRLGLKAIDAALGEKP